LDFGHHQELWERFGIRAPLNDVTVLDDMERMRPADAPLSGALQRVVAPPDPVGCGCGPKCLMGKVHKMA
jgi:hypothetical protein